MKKIIATLLASVLLVGGLSACQGGAGKGNAKTGLAVMTSNNPDHQKAPEADKEGTVEVATYVAAVLVDKDGKVVKAQVDNAQSKFGYTEEGVTTPADTVFKTKKELGPEYNMKGNSEIGKEWNEQAAAWEEYVVGKTAEEIKGIAVDEEGKPTDEKLTAGVTITVTGLIDVTVKAIENAKELGASAKDKLGLGVVSNAGHTSPEQVQQYNTFAVVTLNDKGEISSTVLDCSQPTYKLEAGKVTGDLAAEVKTKHERGAEYGMKENSEIGKEWNEQADAFVEFIKGKKIEDVTGIAVEEGVPTDEKLSASVSITITDFQTAYEKAGKNAN